VPDRELGGDDGEGPATPRKRTRRGTRGGRNRKKKPAADAAATTVETPADLSTTEPQPAAVSGDDGWGYTPMSEWGLDGE
jgi:hypothetical protein